MPDLTMPTADRLKPPSWKDARLLTGLLLVLVSVVLGAYAVRSADHRVARYAAAGPLVVGQELGPEDVVRVDVALTEETADYLSAAEALPAGARILRDVREGELVPASAVGSRSSVSVQQVPLPADDKVVARLAKGSLVNVYVAERVKGDVAETYGKTSLLLEGATVARVPETTGSIIGGSQSLEVDVLVPVDDVQEAIDHKVAKDRFEIVLAPGSAPRPAA
ncbi:MULTISPECIES: hypothetical protein [unclassified Janibacter]|uniref:hypothetical protein n=1 Tax=unclassified Janibacter TaxID=2649294 RepID=UPI003CFDE94D